MHTITEKASPDSKVHGANMVLPAPDGPHIVPMNLVIREGIWCQMLNYFF